MVTHSEQGPSNGRGDGIGTSSLGGDAVKKNLKAGLYLVATPIGNVRDISLRALDVLSAADVVACEDTRVTGRLLERLGIKARLTPYHDHNAEAARATLIKRLEKGETVALVTDAGTPMISDPGYKLVQACQENGIYVTTLPGPSSVLAALTLAGLPTDRFLFAGFLPAKTSQRKKALESLRGVPATLVFLESAKRLVSSLRDMSEVLGDREAAMTRELTKLYEEVRRGRLTELAQVYADAGPPKGEVTLVIGPPDTVTKTPLSPEEIDARLRTALDGAPVKTAAAAVAQETGLSKRTLYNRALVLKGGT